MAMGCHLPEDGHEVMPVRDPKETELYTLSKALTARD